MIVVNLFGAPGAGKSTGAAYLFYQLKSKGYNVELITEFAKDCVWEENSMALKHQPYIYGQQSYRIARCKDKVDVLITDSPLMLCGFYGATDALSKAILEDFQSYDNMNFFINRVKPYNPKGRLQNEDESDRIKNKLLSFLQYYNIRYDTCNGNEQDYNLILQLIENKIKE